MIMRLDFMITLGFRCGFQTVTGGATATDLVGDAQSDEFLEVLSLSLLHGCSGCILADDDYFNTSQ
jgi:hypothetical protein